MGKAGDKSYKFFLSLLKTYKNNIIAFAVALSIGLSFIVYEEGFAYKITVDGETMGITKNIDEVKNFIEELHKREKEKTGTDIVLNQQIKFERVRVGKKGLTDVHKIYANLENTISFNCKAAVIIVDGKFVTALKSEKEANKVLEMLKNKYAKDSDRTYFKEDVKIEEKYIPPKYLVSREEALKILQQPVKKAVTYTVKENDSLWSIARDHDMYIDDILKLNPGLIENLKPGQVIYLSSAVPNITVVTEKRIVYKEGIPFETKLTKDEKLYTNQSKVLVEGKKGLKEVTAVVVSYNGVEVSKKIKSENVLENPINKIVAVGSKRISYIATGSFNYPARGTITSRFGQRWGRLHTGVDIAAPPGSPIYAADGGTVIFSGWESGYGYLVKIDHHNGYVTYYGHASKLLVKKGDKVAKGQKIALVGSSGYATGPHLHFEVRKNGVPVNPLPYLNR